MVARVAFFAGQNNHVPLMNQLVGFRNVAINGGFQVNRRKYVSGAGLAVGSYGHDRWKAGASGGDYSFTQLPNYTLITIAANKSLIQVVEDKNVVGGTYVLSWTGTALGRVGLNSATPSGSFAASPIVIAGQLAGTTMSWEFGNGASAGTLGLVQCELGLVDPTDFEVRPYPLEEMLCARYLPAWQSFGVTDAIGGGQITATVTCQGTFQLMVPARVAPTSLAVAAAADFTIVAGGASFTATAAALGGPQSPTCVTVNFTIAGATVGQAALVRFNSATGLLLFNGCEL